MKYYNIEDILNNLLKEIENINDCEDKSNKVKSLKNYHLLYTFYEESSKMKLRYHKDKSSFKESNFEEVENNYFKQNLEKIEFFYNNTIPADNKTLKPNISIIKNIIELLMNKDVELNDIKIFSKIQNISCQTKLLELIIINNLLLNLNNENNISFLIFLICKKLKDKLNIFFDKTYCVDYFILEKIKKELHILLYIYLIKIIIIKIIQYLLKLH